MSCRLPASSRLAGALACLAFTVALPSTALAQKDACLWKSADLAKAFGMPFDSGKPEMGIGPACTYTGNGKTKLLLWVGFAPASGPFESMKFMIGPPKTEFVPVAGDADKAMMVTHTPNVPAFPHIAYMRGGQLVQVHLRGAELGTTAAERRKASDEYNKKLLALPRVP